MKQLSPLGRTLAAAGLWLAATMPAAQALVPKAVVSTAAAPKAASAQAAAAPVAFALVTVSQAPGSAGPALPALVARDSVAWDLVFEAGNRRCRLFFHDEPRAGGYTLAMPAGCRKAMPMLEHVTNWLPGAEEHVTLRDETGASVIDFAPDGTNPYLSAQVGAGETYTLNPVMPAIQEAIRGALTAPALPDLGAAEPAGAPATRSADDGVLVERGAAVPVSRGTRGRGAEASALPMPPVSEVAGNYAVLRDTRDTGCMVTLEPAGAARGDFKARLAPACRDQGIVIFDPAEWRLSRNALVLKARRGHSVELTRRDAQSWTNNPARGAALVLKRL